MFDVVKAMYTVTRGSELIITSTWEGLHLPWSKHYQKCALDFRYPHGWKSSMLKDLRKELGNDFDIVLEKDHIHIEYDPKR